MFSNNGHSNGGACILIMCLVFILLCTTDKFAECSIIYPYTNYFTSFILLSKGVQIGITVMPARATAHA